MSINTSSNTALSGNQTETIQGFTYGYGVIFDVKRDFQVGLVGGYDFAFGDLSKTYVYQNKNWFAFPLNYKFLDVGKKQNSFNKIVAENKLLPLPNNIKNQLLILGISKTDYNNVFKKHC